MSLFDSQPPKGFFADKWEDVVYWWEDKVEQTNLFGFWGMLAHVGRSIWMTLVWQWVRRITRVIQWIPVLWNNYDWDYAYLLEVIDFKLKRMQKEISQGMCIQESIDEKVGQIQECLDLIKQIQDNNLTPEEDKVFEEKYGELQTRTSPAPEGKSYVTLDFYYTKTQNDKELNDIASDESMKIHDLEEKRRQEAYDKLFSLMAKNLRGWWD